MPDATRFVDYPARYYLDKYYSHVGRENAAFLRTVGEAARSRQALGTVVELGGGPSLCGMFAMVASTRVGPERVVWLDAGLSNIDAVDA